MPVLGKNLSAGGLLLASKTALDLGVKIQISVPVNPVEPLVVTGKVVHIAPHGPDSYAIGIAFPHASRLAAEEIAVFMRQ
jgi:Tfp pilus assembly protein PilZ